MGLKIFHSMQENRKDKEKFNQIVRLNNLKLYEEAYTLFNDLKESKEIPKEITESISAARVQYGKETNAVRSELIRNVEKVSNSKKKSELLNIIGLTFQMEADSNKAEEYYRNSFIQDPKSEWPFLNSLVIKFKKTKNLIMNSELKKDVIKNYKEAKEDKSLVGVKIKVSSHQLGSFYRISGLMLPSFLTSAFFKNLGRHWWRGFGS